MSEVKVTWSASKELRTQELVATGDKTDTTRTFTIDLTELTPEERQAIVVHIGVDRIGYAKIDMQNTVKFDAEWYSDGLRRKSLYFDAEPTVQQVIEWIIHDRAERAESKAHLSFIAAEKQAEVERKTALHNEYWPQVKALIVTQDYDGLGKVSLKGVGAWHPKGKESLYDLIEETRKEISTARAKANKDAWVAAYGSDRLQRGLEQGHNCQRRYVIERAAQEAPGFVVDFNDTANWKDRSCPTTAALDAADDAKVITNTLNLAEPIIVWLTAPASNNVPTSSYRDYNEEWDELWEAREAVVIGRFFGYDLVREV